MSARTRASSPGGGGLGDYKYLVDEGDDVYDNKGILVHVGADITDAVEWAWTNLTAGRTFEERIVVLGTHTIPSRIDSQANYALLDFYDAQMNLANNVNDDMLRITHSYVKAFGGYWDGNKANQGSGNIIHTINAQYVTIADAWLTNADDDAIYVEAQGAALFTHTIIERNHILSADAYGVHASFGVEAKGIEIKNNWIKSCGACISVMDNSLVAYNCLYDSGGVASAVAAYGFQVRIIGNVLNKISNNYSTNGRIGFQLECHEGVFVGNAVWYVDGNGVQIGGHNNTIADNQVNGSQNHGIYVNGYNNLLDGNAVNDNSGAAATTWDSIHLSVNAIRCVVSNNSVWSAGGAWVIRDGIRCLGSYNVIEGNSINGGTNTGCGIFVSGGTFNIISDNVIYDCGVYGIELDADANYNQVEGNSTAINTSGCACVNSADCDNNMFTNNCFDEGNISDAGTNTRAWLNYDPSANVFITTINAPVVVGGGGGALP
jgi:parallel beta-helix repeat protein